MVPDLPEHLGALTAVFFLTLFWFWESVAPFFRFEHRGRHLARNLFIAAINVALLAGVFSGLVVWTADLARQHDLGMLRLIRLANVPLVLGSFILLDGWAYWWHRINHKVRFLWRFHRVHHSDPAVDVSTAARFHFGEIALSSLLRLALILLLGIPIEAIILFDVIQFPVIAFHHANIGLSPGVDRFLCLLIVTPSMHKVHHSREKSETDSNYSSMFSVWDRVFGSFGRREDDRGIRFGLPYFESDSFQSVPGLLWTPMAPIENPETGNGKGGK